MGNLLSSNSSNPPFYKGIKLLLADPDERFPQDFKPEDPFEVKVLERASHEGFIRLVERKNGETVVPLEGFEPHSLKELAPEDVELRNDATYIVVPRRGKTYEKRVSSFALHVAHCYL